MTEPTPSRLVPLAEILRDYAPGSQAPPWMWDDEDRWLRSRVCVCCGRPGHYQERLEEHLRREGRIRQPICLGDDGRIWDGHHRIVAARRLGFDVIPVEVFP